MIAVFQKLRVTSVAYVRNPVCLIISLVSRVIIITYRLLSNPWGNTLLGIRSEMVWTLDDSLSLMPVS